MPSRSSRSKPLWINLVPFVVQVQVHDHGLGTVLSQIVEGEEHPVCYLSRKFLSREQKYLTVEKEHLAIGWS